MSFRLLDVVSEMCRPPRLSSTASLDCWCCSDDSRMVVTRLLDALAYWYSACHRVSHVDVVCHVRDRRWCCRATQVSAVSPVRCTVVCDNITRSDVSLPLYCRFLSSAFPLLYLAGCMHTTSPRQVLCVSVTVVSLRLSPSEAFSHWAVVFVLLPNSLCAG